VAEEPTHEQRFAREWPRCPQADEGRYAAMKVTLTETRPGTTVRRDLRVDGVDRTFWEFSGPGPMPDRLQLHDAAVLAVVFRAMSHAEPVVVDGPVSRNLLAQLEEFMECWASWRPDRYRPVDITAVEEVAESPAVTSRPRRAVAAFSGGVDANYSIFRHTTGQVGRRAIEPVVAVLVHGFDIPLDQVDAFEVARRGAESALGPTGLPLATVRTNWTTSLCTDWPMEFGAAFAAILRQWHGPAECALTGSDDDYGHLVIPWGSSPIGHALLSTPGFEMVHDGAGRTRTEKVADLARWGLGLETLRVCWQGPVTGTNCGECEKCLRTKMNFLAAGAALPPTLAGPPSAEQVLGIEITNATVLAYLVEVRDAAERSGVSAPWLDALRLLLERAAADDRDNELERLTALVADANDRARAEHRERLRAEVEAIRLAAESADVSALNAELDERSRHLAAELEAIHATRTMRSLRPFRAAYGAMRRRATAPRASS